MGGQMSNTDIIVTSSLYGVKKISISNYRDDRGSNTKVYSYEELLNYNISFEPLEILTIFSKKNVLRGLHYQCDYSQSRLIVCLRGDLFIAVADVNKHSETYLGTMTYRLANSNDCIYIPKGLAVGTLALTDTEFLCICGDNRYYPEYSRGIRWDDSDLAIEWPIDRNDIIVSGSDSRLTYLNE